MVAERRLCDVFSVQLPTVYIQAGNMSFAVPSSFLKTVDPCVSGYSRSLRRLLLMRLPKTKLKQ